MVEKIQPRTYLGSSKSITDYNIHIIRDLIKGVQYFTANNNKGGSYVEGLIHIKRFRLLKSISKIGPSN